MQFNTAFLSLCCTVMSLPGKTPALWHGCHGCAHADSTVTSQRHFVSLKDDKYSLFWIWHVICCSEYVYVYLCAKHYFGNNFIVNGHWSGSAQVIHLRSTLIFLDKTVNRFSQHLWIKYSHGIRLISTFRWKHSHWPYATNHTAKGRGPYRWLSARL